MKIGLGTVQFGANYGISNQDGKTSLDEIEKILDVAMHNGISVIDTAAMYGTSEEALGKTLPEDNHFDIVTKSPRFDDVNWERKSVFLEQTFWRSLRNLNCARVHGLLIHHADDLLGNAGNILFEKMKELKEEGMVRKVGVSVYTAEQIDRILDKFDIDIIQLPINILDQRLLISGHLSKLKKREVEIHARSAFLQGLLLMSPETLPPFFDSIREHLKNYHRTIQQHGLTPVQTALGFLMNIPEIDFIICGVNNHNQLKEICKEAVPIDSVDFSNVALSDASILNPSNWSY